MRPEPIQHQDKPVDDGRTSNGGYPLDYRGPCESCTHWIPVDDRRDQGMCWLTSTNVQRTTAEYSCGYWRMRGT